MRLPNFFRAPPPIDPGTHGRRQAEFCVEAAAYIIDDVSRGIYRHENPLGLAEAYLNQGLQEDPTLPRVHNELAQLYNMRGEFRLAAEENAKGVALQPNNHKFWYNLAYTYAVHDQVRRAFAAAVVSSYLKPRFRPSNRLIKGGRNDLGGGEAHTVEGKARALFDSMIRDKQVTAETIKSFLGNFG